MRNREQQKKPNWISLAVILLLVAPQVAIPVGIIAGAGYLVYNVLKANTTLPKASHTAAPKKTTYIQRNDTFDECPKKLFCFHKDKGEHHVRKGREMDPWDRPDIDIRKYQRNR